jgi:hypothetical protein
MDRINATAHARKRMNQRSISEMQIKLIETFGEYAYQKGGSNIGYLTDRTLTELRQAIDNITKLRLVLGETDKIITVMHEKRRVHKTNYRT